MQNTDCCRSCDVSERTRVIDILGKQVRVKNYICSEDGVHYRKKPENVKLQMSVCPTSFCPGACRFCVAKDTGSKRRLDIRRLEEVIMRLKEEDRIRGVKITGGEPFYDVGLLNEVVSTLYGVFGFDLELSVSTNGINLEKLHEIKDLEHIESIHISRHHYDDETNRKIFGFANGPSGEKLKEIVSTVPFKDIFVFNCMLLKDFINSPEEAHRFLDFSISVGVPKVAFMTCSPVNDYARDQSVPFEAVLKDNDPSLLFTRGFHDYEFCHCRDGVYASGDAGIVEFYGRSTLITDYGYSRGLVYDADDHLRDGFGGEVIV